MSFCRDACWKSERFFSCLRFWHFDVLPFSCSLCWRKIVWNCSKFLMEDILLPHTWSWYPTNWDLRGLLISFWRLYLLKKYSCEHTILMIYRYAYGKSCLNHYLELNCRSWQIIVTVEVFHLCLQGIYSLHICLIPQEAISVITKGCRHLEGIVKLSGTIPIIINCPFEDNSEFLLYDRYKSTF